MPNRFQNHGSSDDGSRQRRGAPLRRRGLAHLEVGDERFNSNEIERLYEALRKPSDRARRTPHSGNETDRASLGRKIVEND